MTSSSDTPIQFGSAVGLSPREPNDERKPMIERVIDTYDRPLVTDSSRKKTPKLSTAARILVRLLERTTFAREHVAELLVVPPEILDQFASGALAIPLDRQLALATLLIERVPELARDGHRLRGQVEAAIAYEAGTTETHSNDSRRTNFW